MKATFKVKSALHRYYYDLQASGESVSALKPKNKLCSTDEKPIKSTMGLFDKFITEYAELVKAKGYGKGFSRSNILYMRKFYIGFPKSETVSHVLSWSHYFEILKSDDPLEISFYIKECEAQKWSVRELKRHPAAGSDEMDRPLRLSGHETLHRHCREDQGQCHEAL